MITKAIAQTLTHGQELHYTGRHACTRTTGPRGGIKVSITTVRVTGQLRTWVTRPEDFIIPVKYGLYESSYIDHNNGADFHLPEDCPLKACIHCGQQNCTKHIDGPERMTPDGSICL